LLNLDATHHRYGPKTPAGYTAQAYIDTRVQSLIDALQKANLLERTTILVVSDHGFKTAKRAIRANVALRQGGLLQGDGANLGGDAFVIPEGGVAMAYVTDPKNKGGLVPKMKEMFTAIEGVDRVLEPADYPRFGLPTPAESDQAPDLILVAKDGYSFSGGAVGDPVVALAEGASPGNHGYLSDDPEMDAIFIAWGYGVRGGERLGVIHNVDIAPTIAALLGLKMEGVAGRRLDPALKLPETARN
jgi:predicted AlkP superfamily pyrophosphatase or phosphodiesterase